MSVSGAVFVGTRNLETGSSIEMLVALGNGEGSVLGGRILGRGTVTSTGPGDMPQEFVITVQLSYVRLFRRELKD